MNSAVHRRVNTEATSLLKLVDFKWLMAGLGWRIDLTRLQTDRYYASKCLELALGSSSELLKKHGAELLGLSKRPQGTG